MAGVLRSTAEAFGGQAQDSTQRYRHKSQMVHYWSLKQHNLESSISSILLQGAVHPTHIKCHPYGKNANKWTNKKVKSKPVRRGTVEEQKKFASTPAPWHGTPDLRISACYPQHLLHWKNKNSTTFWFAIHHIPSSD